VLPLSYALRNLWRRRTRTVVTVLGVALVTLLVVVMVAFARGLRDTARGSARPEAMYLLGISSEVDLVRSVVARGSAEAAAAAVPGVLERDGVRAASVELHLATRTGKRVGLLRGVTPAAYLVHPGVTAIEGREPREPFELMAGRLAGTRMGLPESALRVGATLELEGREWTICGRFAAPGTVLEAELWGRLDDIMVATKRQDVSCVALRLESPKKATAVRLFAARRMDLEIGAVSEAQLLARLDKSMAPVVTLAQVMSALVLVAGAFACANTMFAAVLARTHELATLRALGYGPLAVVGSLVAEGALVAAVGGAVGCLAALAIGDVALRYPMGALVLELDAPLRAFGLAAALVAGILGGLPPALRAVRIPLADALGGKA
jgi:hypothetical protein